MKKYTAFINTHKKGLMIIFALINIIAFLGVIKIRFNPDFSIFSSKETVYQDRLDSLEESFGTLNQIVVLVEHPRFDTQTMTDLRTIQSDLEDMDNVVFVEGVAPKELPVNNVMVPINNLSPSQLLTFYGQLGEFSPLIVEQDTYYSVFNVFISDDFGSKDVSHIEKLLAGYSYASYISGDSYNQLKISDYIFKILVLLPPLTILVILMIFRWQMGSFKPTYLSILPAAMGSLWTFGLIGWLGNEVTLLTAIVPILVIVIGSADGLHFMTHYQDSLLEGILPMDSLNKTLSLVGMPMIVTTLTSMVGFLSLLTMNTNSVVDLAIYSAIGILFAGIATWYVLPLLLVEGVNVLPKKQHKEVFDFSKYLKYLWGIPSLILVIVILGVSLFSFSKINHEFNMLMIYKDYTVVNVNAKKIQEVNSGSIPLYVTVDTGDSPLTITALSEVDSLAEQLKQLKEVGKVINPYDFMKLMYNLNNPGDIPNDLVLSGIYDSLNNNDNRIINNLVSVSSSQVRLLVFPSDLKNDTLIKIENTVNSYNSNASVTGVQYIMKDLNLNIARMQINSILLALGVVLATLIITLKSFKIAIYSLLPIVVTVGALYGFLGLSGIPLNITTVIIFSITIGVGIDYAVHFSSIYKHYLNETLDSVLAVEKAYKNSAKPIITNAVGISLGLSVLMLSPLNIHLNVSILMWVSMTVSVLVTLTLLPTIFLKIKKD